VRLLLAGRADPSTARVYGSSAARFVRSARGGGGRFGGPAGPPQRADEATIQLLRERMEK
jgi:hypothetical protein